MDYANIVKSEGWIKNGVVRDQFGVCCTVIAAPHRVAGREKTLLDFELSGQRAETCCASVLLTDGDTFRIVTEPRGP